jgi:hypothetical protein
MLSTIFDEYETGEVVLLSKTSGKRKNKKKAKNKIIITITIIGRKSVRNPGDDYDKAIQTNLDVVRPHDTFLLLRCIADKPFQQLCKNMSKKRIILAQSV